MSEMTPALSYLALIDASSLAENRWQTIQMFLSPRFDPVQDMNIFGHSAFASSTQNDQGTNESAGSVRQNVLYIVRTYLRSQTQPEAFIELDSS
jgi:hypothetical protein